MGKHKNMGTPWHLETLRMSEGDSRRNKRLCRYFDDGICKCIASDNLFMGRCMGSAHCDYYSERQPSHDANKHSSPTTVNTAYSESLLYIRKIQHKQRITINDINKNVVKSAIEYVMRHKKQIFAGYGVPKKCCICGDDIEKHIVCDRCRATYL